MNLRGVPKETARKASEIESRDFEDPERADFAAILSVSLSLTAA